MSSKRVRGPNYTQQEMETLLHLVKQYSSAIEDKRTGAMFLAHKKEAWKKVCIAYNAVATSGLRKVQQLKILYENLKQKAKRALAAKKNNEYIKNNTSEGELKETIQHAEADEGQFHRTGDGGFCPAVEGDDIKVEEILKVQVTPLTNCYDSAANYFGDVIPESQENYIKLEKNEVYIIEDFNLEKRDEVDELNNEDITSNKEKSTNINTKHKVVNTHKRKANNKGRKEKGEFNDKQLYFKRKCQNALLERKRIYQEIRLRQREHKMLVKLYQLRFKVLQKELHVPKMNNAGTL